jgi:hypothetical protein
MHGESPIDFLIFPPAWKNSKELGIGNDPLPVKALTTSGLCWFVRLITINRWVNQPITALNSFIARRSPLSSFDPRTSHTDSVLLRQDSLEKQPRFSLFLWTWRIKMRRICLVALVVALVALVEAKPKWKVGFGFRVLLLYIQCLLVTLILNQAMRNSFVISRRRASFVD